MENWRDVLGYEGLYQVSDEGRVRSLTRVNNYGRMGSQALSHKGPVVGVSMKDSSEVCFDTAATAARALHLSTGQLCDAINGKAKSCGGYYWRRVNG